MNKRKVYNYTRRTLAFLLSMIMTLSVLQGASVTAYAQTGSDVVVTETESSDVIEETETTVSDTEEASETVTEEVDESITGPVSTEATSIVEEDSSQTTETVVEVVETIVEEAETITVVDVMEDNNTYTGEVSEDESTLTISENGVVTAGGTFDDATIIGILETRANASENYSTVVVEYNSITDVVSQNLWNAFVGIGANTIVLCFDGSSAPDERWTFYAPSASDMGDSSLAVDISVRDDGNITFSREYINYSCSGGAVLELCLDDLEAQAEWFEAFKSAYGEESVEYIEIRDEDNNERSSEYGASYSYSDDSCVMAIDFGDTYGSTTFSLHKPHMGYERTEDDGRSIFVIDEWVMPSNRGINQNGLSILEANSNKYDVVEFIYRPDFEDKCTGYVVMDVWNTACSMLKESTDNNPSQIRVNFCGGATEADENWCIDNPQTIDDSSVFLEVSLTPSTENNGAVFEIEANGIYNVTESNVSLSFCVDENGRKELFDSFVNAYGEKNIQLEFYDESGNLKESENLGGNYHYNTEDRNISIDIYGVTQLDVYSPYSVVERIYKGEYNEWDDNGYTFQSLYIHPGNVDQTSFSAEQIVSILGNYAEKAFDEITVVYCTDAMGGTVDDAIINATLPYLKDSSEDRTSTTRICFQNPETNEEFSWILVGPGTQTADQNLTGSFAIVEGEAVVSVGSQTFVADCVNLNISRSNESDADGVAALKALWGEKSTALSVGDTDVPAGFDMDDWGAWVWIDEINQLTPDTPYTIAEYIYKGRIDTWDDGTRELSINFGEAGVESFSEEELLSLLGNYSKEDNINVIYIEQPRSDDNNMIYKSVADAAAALVNTEHTELKFAFCDPEGNCVIWCLAGNPSQIIQTKDQNVKAGLWMGLEENAAFISAGEQSLVAPEIALTFTIRRGIGNPAEEHMLNAYGSNWIEIETEDLSLEGSYFVDDYNVVVNFFGNPNVLDPEQSYKVIPKTYRGEVHEEYDEEGNVTWTQLYISSYGIEKDLFDINSFKQVISFWTEKGIKFDNIHVEQSYTTNNIINKDIFNAAKDLLSDPENQEITFVFCRCEEDIQSDMNWTFQEITGNATKNINANAIVEGMGGAGVSVKVNSNTYPAVHTHLQFWMDEKAYMVQNVLVPSFGKAQMETEENPFGGQLLLLEKAATLKSTDHARYDRNPDEGKINFFLRNIEEWTPGIDNRLVEAYYRPEIAIGKAIRLPLFSYDPSDPEDPGYPPEDENEEWNHPDLPKSNIAFKLLTPQFATLADYDKLTPQVPGKMIYTLCTYTSVSNKTCIEVLGYPTIAKVTGLAFDNLNKEGQRVIEWDGQDLELAEYLKVKITPAVVANQFWQGDFDWSVSGNSIELIEYESETYYDEELGEEVTLYRPDGTVRVIGYGPSTVTVSYGDVSASCVVNVIEPVKVPDYCEMYAVPAVDQTLEDIDLDARMRERIGDYEGTFEWVDDTISLTPFADMESAYFGAYYTVEGRDPVRVPIKLEMIRVTGIRLCKAQVSGNTLLVDDLNNSTLLVGDTLNMGYQVQINKEQINEEGMTPAFATFATYYVGDGTDGKPITFDWKSKETLTLISDDTEEGVLYNNGMIQKPRSYSANKKGKKTFAVSAINTETKKNITSNSVIVTVTEKELFSFTDGFGFEDVPADFIADDEKKHGTFIFTMTESNYKKAGKLTFKSADTSVLKLDKASDPDTTSVPGQVVIKVPYSYKKYGKTVIKVTAADELKTSEFFTAEWIDYEPKLSNTTFTIDKAWLTNDVCIASDVLNIALHHDTTAPSVVTIVEDEYQDVFKLDCKNAGDAQYYIRLAKPDQKNKTYTLTLNIPYKINGKEATSCKQTIKIKVTESKAKASVKQTSKINTFYSVSANIPCADITINPGKYGLSSATIVNQDADFRLERVEETTTYKLLPKEGTTLTDYSKANKNITISYELYNNNGRTHVEKINLSLKTQYKKPTLVLSSKSTTLYPKAGVGGYVFDIYDKATNESIAVGGSVSLVTDKKAGTTIPITNSENMNETPVVIGKNKYFITSEDSWVDFWLADNEKAVKSTDKITIRVQLPGWSEHVDATYSVKVNVNKPKLKLSKKTLTLNINEDVYRSQFAYADVLVTGYSGWASFDEIYLDGVKTVDDDVLLNNFSVNYGSSDFMVSIGDKGIKNTDTELKTGNYKFKVYAIACGQELVTNLTIKVVDKPVTKSVKVSKKGSIDVLRRSTTKITMNPKLSNLSGQIVGFDLIGPDADLFNAYYEWETGNCVVKALYECNYSTKTTYKVTPVYRISGIEEYTVKGTEQKIKVTQGKPKVSTWSNTNTIYGDKSIGALIGFEAMLKDEFITIENVELLNYTNDLDWCWEPMMDANYENFVDGDDPNGHPFRGAGRLTLNDNTPKDITKASGKYTLKFAVTYTDAAGNEKAKQVSYKLNIVR